MTDRRRSSRTTTVSSRPMPTGAMTGSSWGRTGGSWKWPAGRTRGGSSSRRGRTRLREANQVLEWIRQLYDMEDRAGDMTAGERQSLRQRESVPILDRIETYLDELSPRVLPKSALGKAMTYARNQRAALRQYVSDGRLTIDNNVSERTLRLAGHRTEELGVLRESGGGPACGGAVHDPGGSQASSSGAMGLCSRRTAAVERG